MLSRKTISGIRTLFLLIVSFVVTPASKVQESKLLTDFSGPYPGQNPPGMTPVLFADGFVSTTSGTEWSGTFTPDGTEFFFTRHVNNIGGKIYLTRLENNLWTEPELASFNSDNYLDMEPFISNDGTKLFFSSNRQYQGNEISDSRIWVVDKTTLGWSEPYALGPPVNDDFAMYLTISAKGTVYYSGPSDDIYKCAYNSGDFSNPLRLGSPINSEYNDAHPFIARDESFLIFDSQRPSGLGFTNLYISFRSESGSWSAPIQLDNTFNRGEQNGQGLITHDGKYFFFTSDGDIYWADAKALRALAPVDLEATALKIKPKKAISGGGSIKLQGKVNNKSEVYSSSTEIIFYLSKKKKLSKKSILLGTAAVDSLQPGKSRKIKLNSFVPEDIKASGYYLIVVVDPSDMNTDPNKNNNVMISKNKVPIY